MKKYSLLILPIAIVLTGYGYWMGMSSTAKIGDLHLTFETTNSRLNIIAFGDYGTGQEDQFKVFAAAEEFCQKSELDAILLLGDNVYMDGVDSIHDPHWESVVRKPFSSPCLSTVPLLPILGNHDYKGNPDAQIEYSKVWNQWHMPHRFYSATFGDLLEVIALDTSYLDFCFDSTRCSGDFLVKRMREKSSRWQIAMGHHPAHVSLSKHKPGMVGRVLGRVTCGLDAYLGAHNHHLEHLKPKQCQETEYFISGAGGASLYPIKSRHEDSLFGLSTFGFLHIEASKESITYAFFNQENKLLYRYDPLRIASKD